MENDDSNNIEICTKQLLDCLLHSGYEINEVVIRRIYMLYGYGEVKYKIGRYKAIIACETKIKGVFSTLALFRNGESKLDMCFKDPFNI